MAFQGVGWVVGCLLDVMPLEEWDTRVCGEVFKIIELRVPWPGPNLDDNVNKWGGRNCRSVYKAAVTNSFCEC